MVHRMHTQHSRQLPPHAATYSMTPLAFHDPRTPITLSCENAFWCVIVRPTTSNSTLPAIPTSNYNTVSLRPLAGSHTDLFHILPNMPGCGFISLKLWRLAAAAASPCGLLNLLRLSYKVLEFLLERSWSASSTASSKRIRWAIVAEWSELHGKGELTRLPLLALASAPVLVFELGEDMLDEVEVL
jgi:hypothetical protein